MTDSAPRTRPRSNRGTDPDKPVSAGAATAGDRVGDFRLIREIGRGGMGVVYEAQQLSLDRRVAVKLLPQRVAGDSRLMVRFHREARAAARLHHTNIVPVYEVGEEDGVSYYAMQLIEGQSLDRVLRELRRLREEGSGASGSPPADTAAEVAKSLARSPSPNTGRASFDGDSPTGQPKVLGEDSFDVQPSPTRPASTAPVAADTTEAFSTLLPVQEDSGSVAFQHRHYQRSVARIGIQVADALAHAHEQGILHRDIKPSNLLLDLQGRVWITDFGLAKTEDEGLTASGDLVGTLRYMPPERFRGHSDARSDQYSLGITLYEMLALRPAFGTADRAQLTQQITHGAPPRLQYVEPAIPDDLETIVCKTIDRDPQRRYENAAQLRLDLQRFLDDKPIAARRATSREQLWRWCRRNPLVAGLLAALLAIFLLGFTGVTIQWRRAEQNAATAREHALRADRSAEQAVQQAALATEAARREKVARMAAEESRQSAESARQRMRRLLYAARMNLLGQAWEEANVGQMQDLLSPYREARDQRDLRGFAWYYWWRRAHPYRIRFDHGGPVFATAISPDGKTVASAGKSPLKLWDSETGELAKVLEVTNSWLDAVEFSTDGQWLAAAGNRGACLWDLETLSGELLPRSKDAALHTLAMSPDGSTIAAGSRNGAVYLWNVEDRSLKKTWDDYDAAIRAVAWSPDNTNLAVAIGNWHGDRQTRRVFLRNVATDSTRHFPEATGDLVFALDVSPDGQRIAAGGGSDVRLLNLRSGRSHHLNLHSDIVRTVAFSPDGTLLASAGSDRRISLWDVAQRELVAKLRGHGSDIRSLAFSNDGKSLVSASQDHTVKWWDDFSAENSTLRTHQDTIRSLAVAPSGERFATAGDDGTIRLWNPKTLAREATLQTGFDTIMEVTFTPDGGQITAAGSLSDAERDPSANPTDPPGNIESWSLHSDQRRYSVTNENAACWSVAVSPRNRWLAVGRSDGSIEIRRLADGSMLRTLPGHESAVRAVAFSPDGRQLASGGNDHMIRLWNPETGQRTGVIEEPVATIRDLAFSPDGRLLASASEDGNARLWDVSEQALITVLKGHAKIVCSVAYSPDGKTLATGSGDTTIRLWDPASGRQTGRLSGHTTGVHALSFTPDGRTLISSGLSSRVRLWRAATDAEITNTASVQR